ncbi:MAG: co-chaperone GroES, partial [Spirochaetaceae bacterium]|nr:co-chaperone GroES [Spirochaetaceae bacterium]
MTIKPLQDRVLIKVEEAETQTASGLYIPDTAQEKTQTGTVIAIGDDDEMITV